MTEINISWAEYDYLITSVGMDIANGYLNLANKKHLIVGMNRGGLPAAVHLSHILELPMTIINYRRLDGVAETKPELFHQIDTDINSFDGIILVDEIHDSGHSMNICKEYLKRMYPTISVVCAVLVYNTHFEGAKKDSYDVEFTGRIINTAKEHPWVNFPWEA